MWIMEFNESKRILGEIGNAACTDDQKQRRGSSGLNFAHHGRWEGINCGLRSSIYQNIISG